MKIARVIADNGTDGWGESTPFGGTSIAAHARGAKAGILEIAPHLLGRDPRQTDRISDAMDKGLVGHLHAKAAIDTACWDLIGKSLGRPVCTLLAVSTGVPMGTISSISAGDPEDMRARTVDHRARGDMGHSIRIGAQDSEGNPALNAERIAACLADRRPGKDFIADANGGMVPEAARLIAADAADGIGLTISKAGGLPPARRQRDICRAAGLTISVQETTGSDIAFAAITHMGATVPLCLLRSILNSRVMVTRTTADFQPQIRDGGILPPDLPGLGITVNRDALGAAVGI